MTTGQEVWDRMNRQLAEANRARAEGSRVLRNEQVAAVEAMFRALMEGDPKIMKISVTVEFAANRDFLEALRRDYVMKDMGNAEVVDTPKLPP